MAYLRLRRQAYRQPCKCDHSPWRGQPQHDYSSLHKEATRPFGRRCGTKSRGQERPSSRSTYHAANLRGFRVHYFYSLPYLHVLVGQERDKKHGEVGNECTHALMHRQVILDLRWWNSSGDRIQSRFATSQHTGPKVRIQFNCIASVAEVVCDTCRRSNKISSWRRAARNIPSCVCTLVPAQSRWDVKRKES